MSLNIHNGIVEYPIKSNTSTTGFKQFLDNITQEQILASIERVPEDYASKNTMLVYESNLWESESADKKRIIKDY